MTLTAMARRIALALFLGLGAGSAQAATHLISIGICPPWKGMATTICSSSVDAMSTALAQRLSIPADNRHALLNEEATVAGLHSFLDGLPDFGADDRVVLYALMHNGSGVKGSAATAADDVMVFWSEDDPKITEFALAQGKWMKATDFAAAIHALGMGELVGVFDACESAALAHDVLHNAPENHNLRVATVASALSGQIANMNADLTAPLFSSELVPAFTRRDTPLVTLLQSVIENVAQDAVPLCAKRAGEMRVGDGPTPNCNQTPILRDPTDLLSGM